MRGMQADSQGKSAPEALPFSPSSRGKDQAIQVDTQIAPDDGRTESAAEAQRDHVDLRRIAAAGGWLYVFHFGEIALQQLQQLASRPALQDLADEDPALRQDIL